MTELPLLTVNQLSLQDHKRTLFSDINFDLYAGEVIAVMGPSGIGKSMLSKAVAGFLPEDISSDGSILLNGIEVSGLEMLRRESEQRPAVIFQDALKALNPLATVGQQLALARTKTKTRLDSKSRSEVTSLLSQLGFSEPESILKLNPSQLSGGQRQRICIAIALLGDANVLIADEPTSALDPITEQEILSIFRESIHSRMIGGLLITHDLPAAMACDKILVIADNQMVAYGSPVEAIKQSDHPFCQQMLELLGEF
nr:ATP-binding cassette domain-containing protein [Vibrio maerlii]